MTKQVSAAALAGSIPLSTAELLLRACSAFMQVPNQKFKTIRGIEDMTPEQLMTTPIDGTPFELMARVATDLGTPTEHTLAAVGAAYGMDQADLNAAGCWCVTESDHISGAEVVRGIHYVTDNKDPVP